MASCVDVLMLFPPSLVQATGPRPTSLALPTGTLALRSNSGNRREPALACEQPCAPLVCSYPPYGQDGWRKTNRDFTLRVTNPQVVELFRQVHT